MKVIHRMVVTPRVVALGPRSDHGDTEESPSPVPRSRRIKDRAAAPTAPAAMAAHETPLRSAALAFTASTREFTALAPCLYSCSSMAGSSSTELECAAHGALPMSSSANRTGRLRAL